jgi:D-alanyl-D-alanine carboxypeptidase/D-alanyl-D-alanine-endopeptidase (penicillin-binding protein 4)
MLKIEKMKVQLFLVFLLFFLNGHLVAQTLFEQQLQSFLNQPEYRHASVGIQITEVESSETVFETNGEKLFVPASVLKLVTSAAALEILGSGYRFQTRLGYTGNIKNGTLKGDLVIVGGGDPALGSEYFKNHYFAPHFMETWSRQIKAAGIRRVEGNLVLNTSLFDAEKIPPTWIWEDMGNYYGAGASALTVYDNLFRIVFRSPAKVGIPVKIISIYPKVEGMDFQNEVLSSKVNSDLAFVFGSPLDGTRVIRGTIPRNRKAFTIKASNPFPEKLLAEEFIHFLAREGVFLSGKIVGENVPNAGFKLIYSTESPPLAEIVKVLNYESVNLFAEHLAKQIAAEKTGIGSRETGLKIISEFWKNKGLDTRQLFMEDGSGLSHFNAVSPAFLTSVLGYMVKISENSASFSASLPTTGQGTLHHFSSINFPEKTLRAKSGSMKRVRCYAGYIRTNSGKDLAFALMVNHFEGSHQKLISELEKLLTEMHNNF